LKDKCPKYPKCPICGKDSIKVLYYALPYRLCKDKECSCLFSESSIRALLVEILPFNGIFMQYNCSYLRALYYYLFTDWQND